MQTIWILIIVFKGMTAFPAPSGVYETASNCEAARMELSKQYRLENTDYGAKVVVDCKRYQVGSSLKYDMKRNRKNTEFFATLEGVPE